MSDREWVVENTWKCTSCGAIQKGRDMKCNKCGNAKDESEPDIVDSSAPAITDPKLLALANQGPDWVCEYCQSRVRDENGKCKNCSANRPLLQKDVEESMAAPKLPLTITYVADDPQRRRESPRIGEERGGGRRDEVRMHEYNPRDVEVTQRVYEELTAARPPTPWGPSSGVLVLLVSVIGAVLLTLLGVHLFAKHDVDMRVARTSWSYHEELHRRIVVHGSGWGSPGGAFNVSCHSKYYGMKNCHPHDCRPHPVGYSCNCTSYRCNCHTSCRSKRNGFSTCHEYCSTCSRCGTCYRTEYDTCYDQCPVYRDYCEYDEYQWPKVAEQTTTGTSGWNVTWGTLTVADPVTERLDKTETYQVVFEDAEKQSHSYNPSSLQEYRYFNVGRYWKVRTNRFGSFEPLNELPREPVWR